MQQCSLNASCIVTPSHSAAVFCGSYVHVGPNHSIAVLCDSYVHFLPVAGGAAGDATAAGSSYLNLAQHSHQYDGGTSLEDLYGDTAMWIQHHQGGYGGRGGAARMWRSGFGRRR